MGVELQPYIKGIPVQPRDEDFRRVTLMASRRVTVLLDVGANVGQYALRTRHAGYRGRIVSFEPMLAAFTELSARAAGDPAWACRRQASDRPFLRLDVQGFELEALRGAERSLPALLGVQCELSLAPLYAGAPTYEQVLERLEAAGFRLAGIEPALFDPETAELLQADAIFLRD